MTPDFEHTRLALLVHEVRSPVAALSAVAEAVTDASGDNTLRPELVRLAVAASRAIERIVVDIAIDSVRPEPVDIAALARDVIATFSVRGANVVVGEGVDGSIVLAADPVRLRQVLDNLVANALTHAGADRPVTVRLTVSPDSVDVAVSDTGSGIPREELARIFELGVRLDSEKAGSGLGLALSRAIVDAHGGALEVASRPGEGSTFTVVLPRRTSQPDTRASRS
ncbi:MAG TPA: HAMP domain-containing sensor histidine kinase [Gaiellaceae bacterium]